MKKASGLYWSPWRMDKIACVAEQKFLLLVLFYLVNFSGWVFSLPPGVEPACWWGSTISFSAGILCLAKLEENMVKETSSNNLIWQFSPDGDFSLLNKTQTWPILFARSRHIPANPAWDKLACLCTRDLYSHIFTLYSLPKNAFCAFLALIT